MVSIPSERELAELANIAIPEPIVNSREEERIIEGDERDAMVEAHLDTLDDEERAKVETFVKTSTDKGIVESKEKDEKLTPALLRKRRKKMENQEERKKKRIDRLDRKQERLEKIRETLVADIDDKEKDDKIREIEGKKKKGAKPEDATKDETNGETDKAGRKWTLSIALPGSILDNAQSPELR